MLRINVYMQNIRHTIIQMYYSYRSYPVNRFALESFLLNPIYVPFCIILLISKFSDIPS